MIELVTSDDDVFLGWLEARLTDAGLTVHVLDAFTSRLYGGALAALPRRVMVDDEDYAKAREILEEGRRLATR
jgi:hypothetical protein